MDPYAPCMCGSGKKHKWCCQPIYEQIAKAFEQNQQGQHDTALRLIDEVVAANPTNPEPLGRKAQLLAQLGKVDEAEATLQKAFEINPNYAFGHYLWGRFRQMEGEIPGALILLRKAADLYDPEAHSILADVYSLIAECELKLNRPVAARAAFQQAVRNEPADENLRAGLEQVFGPESRIPESGRKEYLFRMNGPNATPEKKAAWQQALTAASGKLNVAVKAFEGLTAADETDAPAWFNLGLTLAWLGDNARALEALDRFITLTTDDAAAEEAWTLAEVLRCGYGMEAHADYVEHTAMFQMRDGQRVSAFLGELDREHRLAGAQMQQEQNVFSALVLEKGTGLVEATSLKPVRLGAYLLIAGQLFRIWNVNKERFEVVLTEIRQRLGNALGDPFPQEAPAQFSDVPSEAIVFPMGQMDEAMAQAQVRANMETFFEETWIHRPRKALSGISPVDAMGSPVLKKKLRGVVRFVQECSALSHFTYDFDRLRRKLGLLEGGAAAGPVAADITAMAAPELAALKIEELADEHLEQAFQAALKLDARELAGSFARALVSRPANPNRADRYPWFTHLINLALAEGKQDDALALIDQGAKYDSEHNEGKRRNDFDLRRAQLEIKRGQIDAAANVLNELIMRAPGELRYRGTAAEAMLSAKEPGRAKAYAEMGLAQARQKNDRDNEQYFLELVAAAKKQGG